MLALLHTSFTTKHSFNIPVSHGSDYDGVGVLKGCSRYNGIYESHPSRGFVLGLRVKYGSQTGDKWQPKHEYGKVPTFLQTMH